MRNIQHKGVEYTIHYPGHIMFSMLEDIGFEDFVNTLQDMGNQAGSKKPKIDPVKLIDFCSKVLYWGVRGGDAFHNKDTGFKESDAKDIVFPALLAGDSDLMTLILEEVMDSWPSAEEEEEPKKTKGSKKK